MTMPIKIDKDRIEEFCLRHHITKLSFFGSVLTDHFRPDSDVDILFDYDPQHIPSLFDVAEMEEDMSLILGYKADMRTAQDLSRYFRDEVIRTAQMHYAA